MKIVADENIPFAAEAFGPFGAVHVLPADAITPAVVHDADALLVRSVTKVNEALLQNSAVRFAGTATIGTDHVDEAYLAARGIPFFSAPGSNADSVAEYVCAALLELAEGEERPLAGRTLGIVGVGNVGKRVATRAEALGLRVLLNDPPRARAEGAAGFCDLPDLLAESDVVTMHVPLTAEGEDRTAGLCDEAFFKQLRPGAWFLNTCRGGVVCEAPLREAIADGIITACVLDVWRNEPVVDPATLRAATLGTPHIAGYSFDGKVKATVMLCEAFCQTFAVGPAWDPAPHLPAPEVAELRLDACDQSEEAVLRKAVRAVYPIRQDDAALRRVLDMGAGESGPWFKRLRKDYPRRREFPHTRLSLPGASDALRRKAEALGFGVHS